MSENKKSTLDAILAQYETNSKPRESSSNNGFDLKNYFSTYLPEGTTSAKKKIRILPAVIEGDTPFTELYIHTKEVDGTKRKFTCLKEMYDEPCPFCEAREVLYASGTDADKELAKNYYPRRTYVCRLIDREAEDEGVKFWRFNHDFRNQGVFDKIIAIISEKGNVTSADGGRDLVIHIGRDQNGYTVITSITDADPSPIHADADQVKAWVENTKKWEDVYSVKPYEYLEIIVKGGIPVWDKDTESFIDKDAAIIKDKESEESAKDNLEASLEDETSLNATDVSDASDTNTKPTEDDDDEDDLPF